MVAFAQTKPREKRIRLTREEAVALIAAVTVSVCDKTPPEKVGLMLEAVMNRIINAFDMEFSVCDECGVAIDGQTILLPDTGEDE